MGVDDEEFSLSSFSELLKKANIQIEYQVDFCMNGKEAVDQLIAAYKSNMSYKVIFTDFNMPIMDGLEAISKIRKFLSSNIGL